MEAIAQAHPNVALVKYWGKRDAALNLPAVGSLSVTLAELTTTTRVRFSRAQDDDRLALNGAAPVTAPARMTAVLDELRRQSGSAMRATIESTNNFPTSAGLASSASGYAALVTAAAAALRVDLSPSELSVLARRGSGSAARSIFGGFVEMAVGERRDGADAVATQLLPADAWPLTVLVAVTELGPKPIGSTDGMELTRATAPYWQAWVEGAPADLAAMRSAVLCRDLRAVGELAEWSCLKMHALAMAARPGLVYWAPATVALIHIVRGLRQSGVEAYFTIDAGPQVKVLCANDDAAVVERTLREVPGVQTLWRTRPGEGARLQGPKA